MKTLESLTFENNPISSYFSTIGQYDIDNLKIYLKNNINNKLDWKILDMFFR